MRNYLTDEGRPLEVGLQERTSNRLSAAMDKSHGRERERKRPGSDRVRCQARRGLQRNHFEVSKPIRRCQNRGVSLLRDKLRRNLFTGGAASGTRGGLSLP